MDSDEEMSTHDKVEILSQSISTILRVCAQMSDFINILRELEVDCSLIDSSKAWTSVKMIHSLRCSRN